MLKKAGVVIFIIFCCWTQIYEQVSFLGKGYSVLWLSILYMLGAYIKKYDPFGKLSKRKCFVGYILFILITIITRIVIGIISKGVFDTPKGMNFLVSYTSPTIVISAVLLFCGFSKLNVKENFRKIISFFVPMSFGVYLIHCHPYIYNILNDMFVFITEHNIFVGILEVIVFGLSIFFVCLLIDKIRLIIFKLIKINKIVDLIENTFKKLSKKL